MSRPRTPVLYELIWRVFKRRLIHEYGFIFRSDERILKFDLCHAGSVFEFVSEDNRYLETGEFPVSRAARGEERVHENLVRRVIFMDDLSLCRNCGRFELSESELYPDWRGHTGIDREAMWTHIRSREDRPEFVFRDCNDPALCRSHRSWYGEHLAAAEREREWQEKVQAQLAKAEAARQAALAEIATMAARPVFVYAAEGNGHVKIGRSVDVKMRMKSLQTGCPFPVVLLRAWASEQPVCDEQRLHKRFAAYRQKGEWFLLPETERQSLLAVASLTEI